MAGTRIEWTDKVWNPLVGCSRVSEGCRHCYAERQAYRNAAMGWDRYADVVKTDKVQWTGKVNFVESVLGHPLKWKKPCRIFVNSMSDLFHENAKDEWIDRIFSIMATAKQHTFQVLTKRPARMLAWFKEPGQDAEDWADEMTDVPWPLPNVWLGVSVEDQATADERIPLLLQTPAALRWVSYEPALGPVDFRLLTRFNDREPVLSAAHRFGERLTGKRSLDWIVVGGESGPGARPFDLNWAQQTIDQGREAGVPVFVKQIGSKPTTDHRTRPEGESWVLMPKDKKGGDMAEWPERIRVREYPQ